MPACTRCNGSGFEEYEEDGRWVRDACYHCGNTGQVDAETARHDALGRVASALAYQAECEYKHAVNSDPEGDGYSLGAAENMMSDYDYFRCRVWDREPEILEALFQLSEEDQDFLIAWNETDWSKAFPSKTKTIMSASVPSGDLLDTFNRSVARDVLAAISDPEDDIPF